MNEETEIDPNTDTTGIYTFEAGKSYQIKISSTGSVESSGFPILQISLQFAWHLQG